MTTVYCKDKKIAEREEAQKSEREMHQDMMGLVQQQTQVLQTLVDL